jgi:hypothetical protein
MAQDDKDREKAMKGGYVKVNVWEDMVTSKAVSITCSADIGMKETVDWMFNTGYCIKIFTRERSDCNGIRCDSILDKIGADGKTCDVLTKVNERMRISTESISPLRY